MKEELLFDHQELVKEVTQRIDSPVRSNIGLFVYDFIKVFETNLTTMPGLCP